MISERTLREAITYIMENEERLIVAHSASIRAGSDPEETKFFYDTLLNFLDVRKHIYDLNSGIATPSNFLETMTGKELVIHFAEIEE